MTFDPTMAIGIGFVAVLLVVIFKVIRSNSGSDRKMDRLLAAGRYAEAAARAQEQGRDREALDYYVRAQMPAQAAQIAEKRGEHRRAGELYERAGLHPQARRAYGRAGIKHPGAGTGTADAPDTQVDPRLWYRAEMEREEQARTTAQGQLQKGDIDGAARTYKEAGLVDEAVHLYVNVLAKPDEAAPILLEAGYLERALELYARSGFVEKAGTIWLEKAGANVDPTNLINQMEAQSPDASRAFLEKATHARPLAADSVELHYRLALDHGARGELEQAVQLLHAIQSTIGPYRESQEWLAQYQNPSPVANHTRVDGYAAKFEAQHGNPVAAAEAERVKQEAARAAMMPAVDPLGIGAAQPRAQRPPGASLSAQEMPQLLLDSRVEAARVGPSVQNLMHHVGGRSCDLQNIEVYYRLGLAHLAGGRWLEAAECFARVEEASPGYQDAAARAEAVHGWQRRLAGELSDLDVSGVWAKKGRSRYTLHGELGRGGMAVVYRATDEVLGRDVALKFLSDSHSSQPKLQALFEREARSVAQLNHPNIITVYDFGVLEGRSFIAMEYVEGVTVKQLLERRQRIPIIETLDLVTQLLDALAAAHRRKIIHRDIKPSNIMRTSSGLVKLMDFGLAKEARAGEDASMVAGTPHYMSPEQMLAEVVDGRTDIFASGVTLYEMLAGKRPYKRLDRSPPVPLRQHNENVPRALEETVEKAMSLPVEDRFATAEQFRRPLVHILERVRGKISADLVSTDDRALASQIAKQNSGGGAS